MVTNKGSTHKHIQTAKESKYMNKQEVFDTVATGLIAQGRQSKDDTDTGCRYRGWEATKCAIGLLIKDEDYNVALENNPVSDLGIQRALKSSLGLDCLTDAELRFLEDLRQVHDEYDEVFGSFVDYMVTRSYEIASDWRLDTGRLEDYHDNTK